MLGAIANLPPESKDGIWFDASVASTVDTALRSGETCVTNWRPSRNNWGAGVLQCPYGDPLQGPNMQAVPPGILFRVRTLRKLLWSSTLDVAGPLSIYAVVGVESVSGNRPRLLNDSTDAFRLSLGMNWISPILTLSVDGMYRQLWAQSANWSQPVGARRVVAISMPAMGVGGQAKWYMGPQAGWARSDEPAQRPSPTPTLLNFEIGDYTGSNNGMVVHELLLLPIYHRDSTVVSIYNDLAAKWGATLG